MGKLSLRNQNKKSRAQLLATLNHHEKGIAQDDRPPSSSLSQRPAWERVLASAVQLGFMYLILLLCIKGLKSLNVLPQSPSYLMQDQAGTTALTATSATTATTRPTATITTDSMNANIISDNVNEVVHRSSHYPDSANTITSTSSNNNNINSNTKNNTDDVTSPSSTNQPKIQTETIATLTVGEYGSIDSNNHSEPSLDNSQQKEEEKQQPMKINKKSESSTKPKTNNNTKGALESIVNYVTTAISSNNNNKIDFTSPLEEYPQTLNITPELRQQFHPVIQFPIRTILVEEQGQQQHQQRALYHILDLTSLSGSTQLIPPENQNQVRKERRRKKKNPIKALLYKLFTNHTTKVNDLQSLYSIGKYDENRVHLYSSQMFQNEENRIDGYDGLRTVHMGIDLGGPVGTKVHSFWNGVVHSVGYNHELGDYGYVIVVQYELPSNYTRSSEIDKQQTVWALYGHLDRSTVKNKVGQKVRKGHVIGRIGDVHENGGWRAPHVHFQLSMIEPETHDMPGAVAVKDRSKALVDYPDPRHVLGLLY